MPSRISFTQYLVGHASLERPPFFYAYTGMWLHMLIGTAILAFATSISLPMIFSSIAIGSFCLSIVIYGLLTREYGLLINIGSYASSISHIFSTDILSTILLVISIIAALVSGYILLAGEYRSYYREIHDEDTINVPQWITLTVGTVVVLLCIFGLNIL
ncbi:MAG TPA: hypothetical protein EYQ18_07410 [Candidatus Handelsmanbacteria bacterium]|nr:hypothetical protein [Candidatus Handelsmanbacteria bacterium]